ncbi:MAG: sortase [Candidatus Doudnabacteria bacterium]
MTNQYISEIHSLLKLGDPNVSPAINGAPEGLPIAGENKADSHTPAVNVREHEQILHSNADTAKLNNNFVIKMNKSNPTVAHVKSFLIYPMIFIIAFGFFYIVLNFASVSAQVQGMFAKPQAQQILGDQLPAYDSWINGYFYSVSDATLLDPNSDIDKDGLSNMDEFIMRTNPTVADSDGDGYPDGMEVINYKNPWGTGNMTVSQKQLADTLDMNLINNRISYNAAPINPGLVAAASTTDYDLSKPGTLSIPRLNLTVPLIWSKDPSEFETDLTKGVIHYPGTAFPGQQGTIYVSGHSSDYIWKHDAMQSIFAKINFLKPGDDIFIDVYGVDGKVHNFRYQVTGNHVYKPDDQTQFIDNSSNKLNLSTCWPIGTSTNRIVVSAVQVGL